MLEIRGLHKSFSRAGHRDLFWALRDVNLKVNEGEFMTWLGPSGCGKTTLLRCLAGLETVSQGDILHRGLSILHKSAQARPFHMVFQRYALFPHMTVQQNIEFPLKIRKVDSLEIKSRVQFLLEMMGIQDLRHQKPDTLSGGQCQRVALARALASQPDILLLDEPLSALDEKIRSHLRQELRDLQRKVGITFIFVTHDQHEAFQISDRIAVFNKGELLQVGTPQDIYLRPQTDFVAHFIGSKNELSKSKFVYPDRVKLGKTEFHQVQGRIESIHFLGREFELIVRLSSESKWKVILPLQEAQNLSIGQEVDLCYSDDDIIQVSRI